MDLSKLSDADLDALEAGKLDKLSDAGLDYLESQSVSAAPVKTKPEEKVGVGETILRGLNVAGGTTRGLAAQALEPIVGKQLVSMKELGSATVPQTSELLARAGVPEGYSLSDIVPSMFTPSGKEWTKFQKGGFLDPSVRGVAGLVGDVALDPSTYFLPALKGAGVLGPKLAPLVSKMGPTATRAAEIALNPLGEAFTGAIKGVGTVGKAVAGKFSQFRPEEAEQYLKNPAAVKEAVSLLSNTKNLDVAQQKAFDAINKMRKTLAQYGKEADVEMNNLLEGKNIQANLNSLKEMSEGMPAKKKAEYLGIIKKAEKDLEAYRPFEPEFGTTTARQQGIEGLTYPQTQSQMVPPSVTEVIPEQQSLFEATTVKRPEYKGIPQPPKSPQESLLEAYKPIEPTEAELEAYYKYKEMYDALSPRAKNERTYRYNKNIADKPIEPDELLAPKIAKTEEEQLADLSEYIKAEEALKKYESKFPQLKQAKEPEFLIPPKTVEKVEGQIIPGKPGYSEYFSPEAVKFSQMMQEPLSLPARGIRPEAATIPAQEARRLKQLLQAEASYGKSSPVTAIGTPRYTEYADEANKLAESLREIDKVKELDDYMRFGIVSQEALEKAEGAPLQFLKNQSEDITAALSRAARRTGNEEVFDLANQLGAARKIIGKGDYDDWVSRSGIRLAGRTALKTIDKFQKTGKASQDMINKVMKDPNVPPQIWMEMLRSKQEGKEQ